HLAAIGARPPKRGREVWSWQQIIAMACLDVECVARMTKSAFTRVFNALLATSGGQKPRRGTSRPGFAAPTRATGMRSVQPSLQFGDSIFDADDLLHSLGCVVGTNLIGRPRLAALHAGKPRPEQAKQLSFRVVEHDGSSTASLCADWVVSTR